MIDLKAHMQRHSIRGSRGADAFRAALNPYFGSPSFEFEPGSKDITAEISLCRLKKIQIFSGSYEQPFRLRIPDAHSFAQGFPVHGSGECVNNRIVTQSSAGHGAVTEPGEMYLNFGPHFDHVCVFMDPAALVQTLAGLIGAPPAAQLRLIESRPEQRSRAPLSLRLLEVLTAELAAEDSPPSPLVIAELEQAILVAFLCGNRHNYSHLLAGDPSRVAPRQVRRVEEYIEANWDQPITIEALAIVANASARSVFHSFKEHRGYSPMNLVKRVRLRRAREMLSNPQCRTTVTSAAFACGFGNLGHFANAYRQIFGEPPSVTLSRARGRPLLDLDTFR